MTNSSRFIKNSSSLLAAIAVAAIISAPVAQADELTALKQQLQDLNARVDTLATHKSAAVPQGASMLTIQRGSAVSSEFSDSMLPTDLQASERGFTLAVTPTADLPAPVAEVTIYGFTKGDVIYDFNNDIQDRNQLNGSNAVHRHGKADHVSLHARQTRFGIRGKVDTSIGQIRTLVEGDFWSNGNRFRARHAWGEWDMTSNWTLGVGHTWSNFMNMIDGGDQVDFYGIYGRVNSRRAQVRLTYKEGPWLMAVAIEDPQTHVNAPGLANSRFDSDHENIPDFTTHIGYTMNGGTKLALTGLVGNAEIDRADGFGRSDQDVRWGIIGAVQVPITEMISVTGTAGYGDGASNMITGRDDAANVSNALTNSKLNNRKYYHANANVAWKLNEELTLNGDYGYLDFKGGDTLVGQTNNIWGAHLNLMWRPVQQMKMGWEVSYFKRNIRSQRNSHNLRGQFGAWFFF